MSFSFDATGTPDDLRKFLDEKATATVAAAEPDVRDETEHLLYVAAQQAQVAIDFYVDPDGEAEPPTFRVMVSGHANPDHKPREGYANEFVQVHVGVV